MGAAPLSDGHLTLVVHLRGGEQEGTSRAEMAGAGKTRLLDLTVTRYKALETCGHIKLELHVVNVLNGPFRSTC